MKQINQIVAHLALGFGVLLGANTAQATTMVSTNPYDVFVQSENSTPGYYTDQLTDWLGKGSLTLTSIFDTGYRSFLPEQIDAAVAGKGPTFTLLRATVLGTGFQYVIGWYNPTNGITKSGGNANEGSNDSFIFNLTTDRVLRPIYYPDPTVSNTGAGIDIYIDRPFRGHAYIDAYGDRDSSDPKSILWNPNSTVWTSGPSEFAFQFLAVYSISVDSLAVAAPVPEPSSWALLLAGIGLIGSAARYRRRSQKVRP